MSREEYSNYLVVVQPIYVRVGDYVMYKHSENAELERVHNVKHYTHGVKGDDKDYMCVNGLYWAYDDTIALRILGDVNG